MTWDLSMASWARHLGEISERGTLERGEPASICREPCVRQARPIHPLGIEVVSSKLVSIKGDARDRFGQAPSWVMSE